MRANGLPDLGEMFSFNPEVLHQILTQVADEQKILRERLDTLENRVKELEDAD